MTEWFIQLGLKRLIFVCIETPLFDVTNHADDLLRVLAVLINSLADGIGIAEVFPREDLVYHYDRLRSRIILIGKESASP